MNFYIKQIQSYLNSK